jgi:hypothetical protein
MQNLKQDIETRYFKWHEVDPEGNSFGGFVYMHSLLGTRCYTNSHRRFIP